MKKSSLIFIIMLFSFFVAFIPEMPQVQAEVKQIKLINEENLTCSYNYENSDNKAILHLQVKRKADEHKKQRLKIKITDEKDNVIDYSSINTLVRRDDWLVEKSYTNEFEGQFDIELPKSVDKLHLSIQMDQTTSASKEVPSEEEIEKNILALNQPFQLDLKTSEEESKKKTEIAGEEIKNSSEQKTDETKTSKIEKVGLAATVSSEKFIGPKTEEQQTRMMRIAAKAAEISSEKYTNKQPVYTENQTEGKYPTHSWTPTNQTNVKNHQGGEEKTDFWDGLTGWAISSDTHKNSYIKYGEDKTAPSIALRKYASETADPTVFDVRLNVRGNSIVEPGVDIIFVLDNSYSMILQSGYIEGQSRKQIAIDYLQDLLDKLKGNRPSNADYLRIGAVAYETNVGPVSNLSNDPDEWDEIVNTYRNKAIDSSVLHTYTQGAVQKARDMFETSSSGRRKILFLLTDGAPNISRVPYQTQTNNNMYYDKVEMVSYASTEYMNNGSRLGSGGSYNNALMTNANGNAATYTPRGSGPKIKSHLTPLNHTAYSAKTLDDIEIHTVAVQIKGGEDYSSIYPNSKEHKTDDLVKGLYKLSSRKADALEDTDNAEDYFFHHVNSLSDFDASFEEWYNSVINSVDKGTITDPLGNMVEYVPSSLSLTDVNAGDNDKKIDTGKLPVIDETTEAQALAGTINIDNINLRNDQEIQVDYKVRLKTDATEFEFGKWYPANGQTVLKPTPERTGDALDFGVPSVRTQQPKDFVINVQKRWTKDDEDKWGLREPVNAILQKQTEDDWETIESIELNADNDWEGAFSAVEGGQTVYRVQENTRVAGYKHAVKSHETFTEEQLNGQTVILTNELLLGEGALIKTKGDGKPFTSSDLPEFSLRRKSDKKILASGVKPTETGEILFTKIPLGEFVIEETHVPTGYEKMPDVSVKAVENADLSGLTITMNGRASPLTVKNHLKDFALIVNKKDQNGDSLEGAAFELTGPEDYYQKQENGPIFTFDWLKAGNTYRLREIETPKGYSGLKEPIQITIGLDGTVEISPSSDVVGSGSIGELNKIELNVKNHRKNLPGMLPYTGNSGIKYFFNLAIGFIVVGGILTCFYGYVNRRRDL